MSNNSEKKEEKKMPILSASKIKTFQSCSWLYWCNYHLKLPSSTNDGALRGSVTHDFLELLAKPRHSYLIEEIIKKGAPEKIPHVKKFLERKFKQYDLNPKANVKPISKKGEFKTNWEVVNEMITLAADLEFYQLLDRKIISSEYEFDLTSESPRFRIRGFIDKVSEEDGALHIIDYKSSSKKFTGDERKTNIQALLYTVAAKTIWPDYEKYFADFLFLRFPNDPYQENEFDKQTLSGFEYFLEYISGLMADFNEDAAKLDYASDEVSRRWLCGAGPTWQCPYKKPMKYWAVLDGEQVVQSFNEIDKELAEAKRNEKPDQYVIEFREYEGCPRFREVQVDGDDSFGF
jgi:ATP-dependent helicase/DNAse subunit B